MSSKHIIFIPSLKEANFLFNIEFKINKYGFYEGDYDDFKIVVSGVSKTNITFASTIIFAQSKPEKAFLIGIAGCYRESGLKLGQVVSVENDYFVDEGMLHNDTIYMTNEMGFPICEENRIQFEIFGNLLQVNSNTVSFLSSDDSLAKAYFLKTKAEIENMEGAAFGLVCSKFNITSYQIRGISNYCGDRDKQVWKSKLALKNLSDFLYKYIVKSKFH